MPEPREEEAHIPLERTHSWPWAEARDTSLSLSHGFRLTKHKRKADGTSLSGDHPLSQWISKHEAKWKAAAWVCGLKRGCLAHEKRQLPFLVGHTLCRIERDNKINLYIEMTPVLELKISILCKKNFFYFIHLNSVKTKES